MQPEKANILLVDDRAAQRLALATVLEELGENVVQAVSGHDALRRLLHQEFAVILLDVNMPGLDGFETAALIRQRQSCQDTPIIFITASTDDTHLSRGYSLGAVDYILTPVIPEVLRTKVGVFVELFKKTAQVRHQADALRQSAGQLHRLTEASLAINAAQSIDRVLEIATRSAAAVIGARQAAITACIEEDGIPVTKVITFSDVHGLRRRRETTRSDATTPLPDDWTRPLRLSVAELDARGERHTPRHLSGTLPLRGWLAAPLTAGDERTIGVLQLSDKNGADFSEDDATILVQLAQIVTIAVENILHNQAREANRIKDEFLSTLSHELRTPLQAMLIWTRVLREERLESELRSRGLAVLERSMKSQQRLIDDLVDVSRIVAGKMRLDVGPFDLARAIETAVDTIRPGADEKEIEIACTLPPQCPVTGDATRVQQIIGNLLSNSVKFTPNAGHIEVRLDQLEGRARIQVRDTGKGISSDFLPHVFERFRQADSSSTRAYGGLGLGLPIVRHLVELHGGTVTAESAGEGKGAVFTVHLPAVPPQLVEPPSLPGADADGAAVVASNALRLDGLTVLIVDDEADTRDSLALALQQLGASVTAVGCTADAVAAIDQAVPDVLLSDLGMPGEDGYELIRKVRARPRERGGRIPAAAITAYVWPEERARALQAGFDAQVDKPVEPDELATTVSQLARRTRIAAAASRSPDPKADAPRTSRAAVPE
jgi:signal transduction histidine kinase/two-component SAPR family response regulator